MTINIHICQQCSQEFPEGIGFEDPRIHLCARKLDTPEARAWWERYDKQCEEAEKEQ